MIEQLRADGHDQLAQQMLEQLRASASSADELNALETALSAEKKTTLQDLVAEEWVREQVPSCVAQGELERPLSTQLTVTRCSLALRQLLRRLRCKLNSRCPAHRSSKKTRNNLNRGDLILAIVHASNRRSSNLAPTRASP